MCRYSLHTHLLLYNTTVMFLCAAIIFVIVSSTCCYLCFPWRKDLFDSLFLFCPPYLLLFVLLRAKVFWEGYSLFCFVLFFSETLRQPGSGTVSVVAQQSSLRHCIWYRSVQINLSWLVCNYIIVTRPGCVWIRVVLLYTVSQPKTSLSHDLLLFVLLSAY